MSDVTGPQSSVNEVTRNNVIQVYNHDVSYREKKLMDREQLACTVTE